MNEKTELTEQEKIIVDNFYMTNEADLIVEHILRTRSSILDNDIKIRMKQLKLLHNIVVFLFVVFTLILIYIAVKGFFHV